MSIVTNYRSVSDHVKLSQPRIVGDYCGLESKLPHLIKELKVTVVDHCIVGDHIGLYIGTRRSAYNDSLSTYGDAPDVAKRLGRQDRQDGCQAHPPSYQ